VQEQAEFHLERGASLAVLAVALTVVTWGLASPLIKTASLSGPALGFYRVWIGAIVLTAILRAGGTPISRDTLRWGVIGGAVFGVNLILFLLSIKMTTVANATLIGALQPAIVLIVAGPWFGEVVTRRQIGWVALAIAGVGIVIAGSAGTPEWNPLGDFLAMLAVLTFTAYFLISKRVRTASAGTLEYMTVVHLAAAVVSTPLALARPAELWSLGWEDVLIVLFFALVSGTLGQLVIGWAHRYVDVSLSSLIMLGVPVVAAIAAWLMLGEPLGPLQIIGAVVTLAAIGAMLHGSPDRPSPPEPAPAATVATDRR
jgi:drug/metabolite transporter (DMT)-like permease